MVAQIPSAAPARAGARRCVPGREGLVHGFTDAAIRGAGLLTAAAVLAALLVTAPRPRSQGGTS